MKTQTYNYRSGQQIIPGNVMDSVVSSINEIDNNIGKYDIRNFNKDLMSKLRSRGWINTMPLSVYSKITITSVRDKIGLCIQTGNVARIYADLLKIQTLYTEEKISAGIVVVPTKDCADAFGKNVANYERLIRELTYVFSKVVTIPMVIVCFSNE